MTEADILSIRNELTGLVLTVVSVSFGMISAYIVGLWLFLKSAPLALRTLAFFVLTCGLAFLGAMSTGLNELLLGTGRAWTKLDRNAVGIPGFGAEPIPALGGISQYEAAAALGAFAFAVIYLALFHLTFVYRWPDDAKEKA